MLRPLQSNNHRHFRKVRIGFDGLTAFHVAVWCVQPGKLVNNNSVWIGVRNSNRTMLFGRIWPYMSYESMMEGFSDRIWYRTMIWSHQSRPRSIGIRWNIVKKWKHGNGENTTHGTHGRVLALLWRMEGHQAVKLMLITWTIDKATAQWLDVSLSSLKMTEMYDSSFLVKTNNNTKSAFLDGWMLIMAATNGPALIHICLSLTVSSFAPITQFIMIYLGNTSTYRIFRNFVLFFVRTVDRAIPTHTSL